MEDGKSDETSTVLTCVFCEKELTFTPVNPPRHLPSCGHLTCVPCYEICLRQHPYSHRLRLPCPLHIAPRPVVASPTSFLDCMVRCFPTLPQLVGGTPALCLFRPGDLSKVFNMFGTCPDHANNPFVAIDMVKLKGSCPACLGPLYTEKSDRAGALTLDPLERKDRASILSIEGASITLNERLLSVLTCPFARVTMAPLSDIISAHKPPTNPEPEDRNMDSQISNEYSESRSLNEQSDVSPPPSGEAKGEGIDVVPTVTVERPKKTNGEERSLLEYWVIVSQAIKGLQTGLGKLSTIISLLTEALDIAKNKHVAGSEGGFVQDRVKIALEAMLGNVQFVECHLMNMVEQRECIGNTITQALDLCGFDSKETREKVIKMMKEEKEKGAKRKEGNTTQVIEEDGRLDVYIRRNIGNLGIGVTEQGRQVYALRVLEGIKYLLSHGDPLVSLPWLWDEEVADEIIEKKGQLSQWMTKLESVVTELKKVTSNSTSSGTVGDNNEGSDELKRKMQVKLNMERVVYVATRLCENVLKWKSDEDWDDEVRDAMTRLKEKRTLEQSQGKRFLFIKS